MNYGKHVFLAIAVATLAPTAAWCDENAKPPGAGALSTILELPTGTDAKQAKLLKSFTVEPKLLQAKDGSNPSLGLAYKLTSKPFVKDLVGDAQPGQAPPSVLENYAAFEFSAKGMLASKAEVNVENVIDAVASATWNYGVANWAFKSAFSGGYAREQGNSTHASRWELSQTAGTMIPALRSAELIARGAYARVNPIKDTARKAALGTDPKDYNRYELELFAILPINMGSLQKIELRHLRFQETGAPSSIKAAGLDRTKLSSIYFRLPNNMFIAYSKGGVPADRKDSQVLQIGWSTSGL